MQDHNTSKTQLQQPIIDVPIYESIPKTLSLYPDWCLFTYEQTDDGYQPIRVGATGSLKDIYGLCFEAGNPNQGIAFLLTDKRPVVAIDLIDCFGADDILKPWAHELLTQLDSYTEYLGDHSLRVLAVSHLDTNYDFEHIKIYSKEILIPIIGNTHGAATDIANREAEVNMIVSLRSQRTWLEIAQDASNFDYLSKEALQVTLEQFLARDDVGEENDDILFLAACWSYLDLQAAIYKRVDDGTYWNRERKQNFYKRIQSAMPKEEKKPKKEEWQS